MDVSNPAVIILAAGMGIRLGEVSGGKPKALVSVGKQALLDHALSFGAAISPAGRKIVVGGYQIELMREHYASGEPSRYELVENPEFRQGNLFSLLAGLETIEGSFYLSNADHIFSPATASLFVAHEDLITVFVDRHRLLGDDDMKVKLTHGQTVAAISKTLTSFDYGYIGVTFVPQSKLSVYKDACQRVKQENPGLATAEKVIQDLTNHGEPVFCRIVDEITWHEIDTPSDFEQASRYFNEPNQSH